MGAKSPKSGHELTTEQSSKGGKSSKRGKDLKTYLKGVLNETIPEKDLQKLKRKYGIDDEISNGEAIVREVVRRAKMTGDIKSLVEIMKITGEYTEKKDIDVEVTGFKFVLPNNNLENE